MWIFNLDGFFSVVETPGDQNMLQVRGRYREDVLKIAFRLGSELIETPERDYPYRVYTSKEKWADYLRASGENIDYPNFKAASLLDASIERQDKYHSVWQIMAGKGENRTVYCTDCDKALTDENIEISTVDGRRQCKDCRNRERIAAMANTFDYHMRDEPQNWKNR